MPANFKHIAIIFFITFVTFELIKKFALLYTDKSSFNIWRNSLLFITSALFLSPSYWVFLGITFIFVIYLKKKIKSPVILFCIILFAAPIHLTLPVAGINFDMNYVRLISIIVLLPTLLKVLRDPRTIKFGKYNADIFFLVYIFIYFVAEVRGTTITDGFRHITYIVVDTFLPYYIISRTVKTFDELKIALFAFFTAILVIGNIGIFEHLRHWLQYQMLDSAYGLIGGSGGYMGRGDDLRAVASTGFPIVLGYMVTIAIGLFLYLKDSERQLPKKTQLLVFLMLLGGAFAPVSRGPWVGAAILYLVFVLINRNAIINLFKLKLLAAFILIALSGTQLGDKLFNLLPFIGKTETHNVEYRERLFEVSMTIIERYPLLGNYDYLDEPEMVKLYQGNVSNAALKVDIVNTYIGVALAQGLIGLTFFVGIYISTLITLFISTRRAKKISSNHSLMGTTFIAIILSIMVMITTVSSIVTIPVVNFMMLGLAIAYSNIIKTNNAEMLAKGESLLKRDTTRLAFKN